MRCTSWVAAAVPPSPASRRLHATLAWSHDLLDEDERVLFRRLAVFAGSMSLEAVEQVCGGGLDVVDLLSRLVDKSLVQAEHADGTARYRLLETIRQFADQRLRDAGERAAQVRAHRDWYVAFAAAHDPERAVGVVNDTPQALDVEHDNLRAALSSGLADDPAEALQLAVSLWRFWLARGHFAEGGRWLGATLAAAPARTPLRARALLAAAAMEVRRGDGSARVPRPRGRGGGDHARGRRRQGAGADPAPDRPPGLGGGRRLGAGGPPRRGGPFPGRDGRGRRDGRQRHPHARRDRPDAGRRRATPSAT